ncbi:MAG: ABC transporter ATP-binding protein [Bacteroidetes bacterium]|nr:ABC transporter ATP-binding protein [Bacteroidota bacterium]
MIDILNLTKEYNGRPVVDQISFHVPEGKTFVLLGTSGSGKTTTLKMLNGLIQPTSGKILINDKDISNVNPESLRKNIGYVIQSIGLFPHMTVKENISVVPKLLKWHPDVIKERVRFLLELLNLETVDPEAYPAQLSGGQQQRVGLARALAADPAIVLMDEPFGALDPITRTDIRNEFKKLEEIINKTIVLVTHDVTEAWELGDIICLMDNGKIMQNGSPKELTWKAENQFVKDFLRPHQWQLEIMTVAVKDVLPFSDKEISLDPDTSLFHAMHTLESEGKKSLSLHLHQAFLDYKTSFMKREL